MTKSVDNVAVALLLERARGIKKNNYIYIYIYIYINGTRRRWGGFCRLSGTAAKCFNIYGREGHFKLSFGV